MEPNPSPSSRLANELQNELPFPNNFELVGNSYTFELQRSVVCPHVLEIAALLRNTQSSRVEHNWTQPQTMQRVISFLYEGDYSTENVLPSPDAVGVDPDSQRPERLAPAEGEIMDRSIMAHATALVVHIEVHSAARYFALPNLVVLAEKKLKEAMAWLIQHGKDAGPLENMKRKMEELDPELKEELNDLLASLSRAIDLMKEGLGD